MVTPRTCSSPDSATMAQLNQIGGICQPDRRPAADNLRPLLSSKNAFLWLPSHDVAFQAVKSALVTCWPISIPLYQPCYRQIRHVGMAWALHFCDNMTPLGVWSSWAHVSLVTQNLVMLWLNWNS